MRSGFCAILGRPNVGKSTLLNALLSKKVSIVTPRAQTTRDDILGIVTEEDHQIVFIDTPGIFEGDKALDRAMVRNARSALSEVDCVLYLIDSSTKNHSRDDKIISSLNTTAPFYLVLNKIDLATAPEMEATIQHFQELFPTKKIIQISALTNFGLKDIKETVKKHLPEGPAYYPENMITDKDPGFTAKEVIREKMLHFLHEEIPHQSAVRIKSFEQEKDAWKIEAVIYVEKSNQKPIVIGKGGAMIKKIGSSARHELERMYQKHVTLILKVEVAPNWRDKESLLSEMGYGKRKDD